MQAAQASNNVPARYDPVRLRRPTTPLTGRGHPIGLGDLSVTAAEPATEVTSVAAGAPARTLRPRRQICIPAYAGWLTVHARRHHGEVCPLTGGVMYQTLSGPLSADLSVLHHHIPA